MDDALSRFLVEFKRVAPAILDSYMVVDRERRIVDFNRAFYAGLPRSVARNLEGAKCSEVLQLSICTSDCIAEQCWRENRQLRLDEIDGRPGGEEGQARRFIVSALPIVNDDGEAVGALEIQRDVTEAAEIQTKYSAVLESEAQERERLAKQVRSRTRELLEANQQLRKTQRELLAYKKGLIV